MSEIRNGSAAATAVSDGLERDLWLVPIDQRTSFKHSSRFVRLAGPQVYGCCLSSRVRI